MRAMVLEAPRQPLQLKKMPSPQPTHEEVLIQVSTCGVCRTDLHIIDGELSCAKLPLIPGHQIVGTIVGVGREVDPAKIGERVGVAWLAGSCQCCPYCQEGRENLCDAPLYTGYQIDGGFAEYCVAHHRFTYSLPSSYSDEEAAPLLCAGLIGYRSLKKVGSAHKIGFYGFGASAHIMTQVVNYQGGEIYAFTRPGDTQKQAFAKKLGAKWVGSTEDKAPCPLDAVIIFAPLGELVLPALRAVKKGGIVVCAGIHMSPIPSFPYELLWEERVLCSVANLTRQDGEEFLALASQIPIHTNVTLYPLEKTNQALDDVRCGCLKGAAVIQLKEHHG